MGALRALVAELENLPGIGRRTAERLAYHILRAPRDEALRLAAAIREVKTSIRHCRVCYDITEREECAILRGCIPGSGDDLRRRGSEGPPGDRGLGFLQGALPRPPRRLRAARWRGARGPHHRASSREAEGGRRPRGHHRHEPELRGGWDRAPSPREAPAPPGHPHHEDRPRSAEREPSRARVEEHCFGCARGATGHGGLRRREDREREWEREWERIRQ